MLLLEEYEELIERDQAEMSLSWKYLQMFLYLISAICGYACCVLFYLLRVKVFEGNCPLWAFADLMWEDELKTSHILTIYNFESNWWKFIIIEYIYDTRCTLYLLTCFSSCAFGIVWLTLFFMCGNGGYDIRIYPAPWRIVFPALCFNFIFATACMYAHYNLDQGYEVFITNMRNVASKVSIRHNVSVDARYQT